ncbi:MAG: hypothetical protein EP350_08740 [Alphaproteobacteria bacterium]|nr:MAG: hypothetical protein EP350_08740 [Alphaproteobacteria bacterium]
MRWFILTPLFKPASAGGAIYSEILARNLAIKEHSVTVLTEKHGAAPDSETRVLGGGSVNIRRIFPLRNDRARKDVVFYVNFLIENLIYVILPWFLRARSEAETRLIVHASFLYKPSLFRIFLLLVSARRGPNFRMILDIRDNYFDDRHTKFLRYFDAIICSARSNTERMSGFAKGALPVIHAPMPFEPLEAVSDSEVRAVERTFGIEGKRYLLNPNGITIRKHHPVMRDAMTILRQIPEFSDVVLVTVGRERDRTGADTQSEARGESRYLGIVAHADMYALMQGAFFTLVLSNEETISRSSLEAMSVCGRIILPNVPEFREDCEDYILANVTPEELVAKIRLLANRPPPGFPFEKHELANYIELYENA